ncbi:MAG: hypothetical protein Q8J63_00760 [Candidatus Aquicultor sp.]|nr:hypothetical protein [Candidatus Aquicultor sp.]
MIEQQPKTNAEIVAQLVLDNERTKEILVRRDQLFNFWLRMHAVRIQATIEKWQNHYPSIEVIYSYLDDDNGNIAAYLLNCYGPIAAVVIEEELPGVLAEANKI